MRRGRLVTITIVLGACAAVAFLMLPAGHESSPVHFDAPRAKRTWPVNPSDAEHVRNAALRRARVWTRPETATVDLGSNPADATGTLSEPIVRCRYIDAVAHGTTAKFDCALRDGEIVKVKYGHTGEIPAEVAASRLLSALGFGADRMFLVPRLRCYGCVRNPFYTYWMLDRLGAHGFLTRHVPDDRYSDFEWASVERHFDGLTIETPRHRGWAWWELEPIDSSLGASREERDAFRLAAVVLSHWDNKAANQRLVCLAPPDAAMDASNCPRPFAFIDDLGATFGPNKVELEHWRATPVWADRARCTVSMREMPYRGSTFPDAKISEGGRQLMIRELAALGEAQVLSLFKGARFPEFLGESGDKGDARAWTRAFLDKVAQIASGEPCPQ
jgi:hypothetical protein